MTSGSFHEDFSRRRDVAGAGDRGNRLQWLGQAILRLLALGGMLIVFVTMIAPIGLAMRAFGMGPLRLRREPAAASYWIERRPPGPAPETMKNQF